MFNANLTNCDTEPIHIPGKVQDHGFLIALDSNYEIVFCSENAERFTGIPVEKILGNSIDSFESVITNQTNPGNFRALLLLINQQDNFQHANSYQLTINGSPFLMIYSLAGEYSLLEFEPRSSSLAGDIQQMVGRSLSEILSDKNLNNLLKNAAEQIRQVIGYDRLMIYKFHDDGHGEVVAETRNDDLESWLGLHYPASDIPQQARELYKKSLVRLIADVHSEPSGILTIIKGYDGTALDLTQSSLRAVSPIHIQYLKNMGVASSFSVSIIEQDKLWGLIACHNYTPRFINFSQRETAKLIGQVLSSAVSFRQQEEDQVNMAIHRQALGLITRHLSSNIPISEALMGQESTLMDAISCTGAVLYYEHEFFTVGDVPDQSFLENLINVLDELTKSESIYHTENLSEQIPEAIKYKDIASGVITCRLNKELREFMIWFRPEIITTVKWAGNPHKSIETDEKGFTHISPRNSFAEWSQRVETTSEQWTKYDIEVVGQLCDEVNYSLSRKATELRILNEKLREAYAELDTFAYTISHDLKNPLTAIKSFAQLILGNPTMPERVTYMADRIDKRASQMREMIDEVLNYSKVEKAKIEFRAVNMSKLLEELKSDLLVSSDNSNLKIDITLAPEVYGDELMINQVFSNLLGNAVKYSSKINEPAVNVSAFEEDNHVTYQISDNGVGIDNSDHNKIFDLFSRAQSASGFEGSGVGLAIVKRIVEKHNGSIWFESNPGKGSTFFVRFKTPVSRPL